MKKRSQSSIRSKTLQSEEDQSEWMGNIQAKKSSTKLAKRLHPQ